MTGNVSIRERLFAIRRGTERRSRPWRCIGSAIMNHLPILTIEALVAITSVSSVYVGSSQSWGWHMVRRAQQDRAGLRHDRRRQGSWIQHAGFAALEIKAAGE